MERYSRVVLQVSEAGADRAIIICGPGRCNLKGKRLGHESGGLPDFDGTQR